MPRRETPPPPAELHVVPMMDAFARMLRVVEALGPLMSMAVRNDEANFEKVRTAWAEMQQQEPSRDICTLRALLEAERASGIHRPGGALADPSAAVALRWMRRSLRFLNTILEGLLAEPTASVSTLARAAYRAQLEQLHGWVVRKTFCAGFGAMPSREDVLQRLGGMQGGDAADTSAALSELVRVQREALTQMQALFIELDLEDAIDMTGNDAGPASS